MKKEVTMLLSLFVCLLAAPSGAQEVAVGDTVFAYWAPADAFFVGTAVEEDDSNFLIVFEDGDIDVVSKTRVGRRDLPVGSTVMARWSDGQYYPGRVARIVGRALYIHYDDGDRGWVPWSGIAVTQMPPSRPSRASTSSPAGRIGDYGWCWSAVLFVEPAGNELYYSAVIDLNRSRAFFDDMAYEWDRYVKDAFTRDIEPHLRERSVASFCRPFRSFDAARQDQVEWVEANEENDIRFITWFPDPGR